MKMEVGMKAVVVGGSSGIGEATARKFAQSGAEVVIAGRDKSRLDAAVKRLGDVRGEVADGTAFESVKRLFEVVGRFDHLVLALSGGRGAGPIATVAIDDIRSGFEGKLFAHLTTLKAAIPFVTSSVSFISAATAVAALPGTSGLAAINGAIEALARPLAVELAPVRVNVIRPGVIDTPWWNAAPKELKERAFAAAAKTLPVKRVGRPDDVADAIFMAATNGFMTGAVLDVSGGATLAR
jgi:NAD(P)-dependent dehydrogenase (short-subunit alcohol dehydrogenase family)